MKTQLRKNIIEAMKRPTNTHNTPEKMASILGVACGISKTKILQFINGNDQAISDDEALKLNSMR